MTIGQKIKELRETNKMLQRQLASQLEVGDGFLSKVERNQKQLKKEDLIKLSEIFNYSYVELKTLWLASKLYDVIKYENEGLEALKVCEQQITYKNNK